MFDNTDEVQGDPQRAGRDLLDDLTSQAREIDRRFARLVVLAAEARERGVAERLDGLPLEHLLGVTAGWTAPDRRFLLTVVETLVHLPTVRAWFAEGRLSWGQVRGIVGAARHLDLAQKAWLDAALAAAAERVAALAADQVVDAVDALAHRAREDLVDERAERAERDAFVAVQGGLFGRSRVLIDGEETAVAEILEGIDTAASHTSPDDDDDDERRRRSRGRRRFDGLRHMAGTYLAGGMNAERPAKPMMHVLTNYRDVTGHGTGTSAESTVGDETEDAARTQGSPVGVGSPRIAGLGAAGATAPGGEAAGMARSCVGVEGSWLLDRGTGPVQLTRRGLDRYACDAVFRAILTDDHGGILGVTAPTTAIGDALRAALIARDLGCRFPGCTGAGSAPNLCHAHHIVYRRHGGTTVLSNLVLLCDSHHRLVHHRGWQLSLSADDTLTVSRGRMRLTSQPAARKHIAAPDPPPRQRHRPRHPTSPARDPGEGRTPVIDRGGHQPDERLEPGWIRPLQGLSPRPPQPPAGPPHDLPF